MRLLSSDKKKERQNKRETWYLSYQIPNVWSKIYAFSFFFFQSAIHMLIVLASSQIMFRSFQKFSLRPSRTRLYSWCFTSLELVLNQSHTQIKLNFLKAIAVSILLPCRAIRSQIVESSLFVKFTKKWFHVTCIVLE